MSLDTFSPVYAPSYNTKSDTKLNLLKSSFGDDYEQRALDGLNYQREIVDTTWTNTNQTNRDYIITFFKNHAAIAFYYQLPTRSSPQMWTVEEWTEAMIGPSIYTVGAKFIQQFDLV